MIITIENASYEGENVEKIVIRARDDTISCGLAHAEDLYYIVNECIFRSVKHGENEFFLLPDGRLVVENA